MRASPALIELLAELHQQSAAGRRAILAGLEPEERQRIEGHLARFEQRAEPNFDALACLSPWLSDSLAEARSGTGGRLTMATREALADAERLLPRDRPTPENGASLLDRLFRKGRRS